MAAAPIACERPEGARVQGYVEGEYVAIAPIDVARIVALNVRRGDEVTAGETIASVETTDAEIAVRCVPGEAQRFRGAPQEDA